MPLKTKPLDPDYLFWAEYWFNYPGGEEAMWRCLLRWASGIDNIY